ncbi:YihA family ribosome biogenesis GTP-binding protein [Rhodoferax sp. 4810]|uniref:Probable GTP-binding protein EngB n=2 Tax=Thiospirillum jenense TaxID=1653858 RepID=A0A839H8Q9_9GAMM|nr:ribosome biogenesis GTP-binding protein YihA/YsxC [Thiospirillum jenense]MBB1073412.1 YihA family ribosome biogenesis GTP-binding protein [Rhodoferax jenense]MBB1125765.1 YihA family ribosome biogenesis GTP-binding protein [Thiospirillum jenense]
MTWQPYFQQVTFLSAAAQLKQAPTDCGYEVAFAGRSNAGKSSAINVICQQRHLARTSKTPGRTQQLIFFNLAVENRRLVDLPGYGFARVALSIKLQWQTVMASYLQQRVSLRGLVMVMDCRHPLTELDRQMIEWSQIAALPLLVLLTKADKLSRGAMEKTRLAVQRDPLLFNATTVEVLTFSAHTGQGRDAAQAWLAKQLELEMTNNQKPDALLTE